MKNLILLCLLVINFSCNSQTTETGKKENENLAIVDSTRTIPEKSEQNSHQEESPSTFNLVNASKTDFDKARKAYQDSFLSDTLAVKKINGQLKLKTNQKWKPFVTFQDTLLGTDNDEIREYKYLGQYKELNHYLAEGYFWEHYECYLIDKETGAITTTWSRPYLSADKKLLANLSMTFGLEGIPNGIQIWKVKQQKSNQQEPTTISKYIEIDQQVWAPYDFFWETEKSIVLKTIPVKKYWELNGEPKETDFSYLRLTLK